MPSLKEHGFKKSRNVWRRERGVLEQGEHLDRIDSLARVIEAVESDPRRRDGVYGKDAVIEALRALPDNV